MSDERTNTITIKFGRDFDAPWLVVGGSAEQMRQTLIEAFSIRDADGHSLSHLIAAVAVEAQAIYALREGLGAKPVGKTAPATEAKAPAKKATGKLAAAAKAAQASNEPADHTDDIPALIANAQSRAAIDDIRKAAGDAWDKAVHGPLAKARLDQLKESAA